MPVKHVSDKNPDGLIVGQSATDKVGFYGTTPAVQPATVAAATNTTTTTSTTTALTTDLDSIRSKLNSVIAHLKTLGLIASA